ncbi:sulfite oxidase heme-binding subunit YedZ [Marinobacter nauticus]|uniref:Protein-methionine-sulfoxide reductase heme-binding subunit MsrQ n=1 Tax=Marinobacter nauticus TaxID=2743 RepID=A0A368USB0_MARNT|nr:protein-methionine-sulfoxide reductase heme-binding subunit MsrQ [Marinobacter nauticus]RBP70363.1 sulfoxide reductase heme-binding subunit YedZ [Marinobacter nauticus]RCW31748.1 sulfoxide reductase heme-binding subunit YedZ [Marinobacter nauticus]
MASKASRQFPYAPVKVLVFLICLIPLALIGWDIQSGNLGPDPGQTITEALGIAAFQFLLITLLISPLRKITGWAGWLRFRRMLGLYAFFYAALHVLAFLQFILGWFDLWATFTKRPYIIAGGLALLLMAPLAATSTRGMMKRMGRGWKPLHRLIYCSALLAWFHFLWQARSDVTEMMIYGLALAVLLGARVYWSGFSTLIPLRKA